MGSIEFYNSIKKVDINNDPEEAKSLWDRISPKNRYRHFNWRKEIKSLCEECGLTLAGLATWIGDPVKQYPGFYTKLPQMKRTYVLIGIALGRNRDTVNRWIVKNTKQEGLYAKIEEDIIGIYFLNLSTNTDYKKENLCKMYKSCVMQLGSFEKMFSQEIKEELNNIDILMKKINTLRDEIDNVYNEEKINQLIILETQLRALEEKYERPTGTHELENNLRIVCDEEISNFLLEYIKRNQRSFKRAHSAPREIINEYVELLLTSINSRKRAHDKVWTRFTLCEEGYISTALYFYLTGKIEAAQTPQKKSTVINYCLQLGMGLDSINVVLQGFGYDTLNINDNKESFAEFILIPLLICFEEANEEVKMWREKYIYNRDIKLSHEDEKIAISKILSMREHLIKTFTKNYGESFPF